MQRSNGEYGPSRDSYPKINIEFLAAYPTKLIKSCLLYSAGIRDFGFLPFKTRRRFFTFFRKAKESNCKEFLISQKVENRDPESLKPELLIMFPEPQTTTCESASW